MHSEGNAFQYVRTDIMGMMKIGNACPAMKCARHAVGPLSMSARVVMIIMGMLL